MQEYNIQGANLDYSGFHNLQNETTGSDSVLLGENSPVHVDHDILTQFEDLLFDIYNPRMNKFTYFA